MFTRIRRTIAQRLGMTRSFDKCIAKLISPEDGNRSGSLSVLRNLWDVNLASIAELSKHLETPRENREIRAGLKIHLPRRVTIRIQLPGDRVALEGDLLSIRRLDASVCTISVSQIRGFSDLHLSWSIRPIVPDGHQLSPLGGVTIVTPIVDETTAVFEPPPSYRNGPDVIKFFVPHYVPPPNHATTRTISSSEPVLPTPAQPKPPPPKPPTPPKRVAPNAHKAAKDYAKAQQHRARLEQRLTNLSLKADRLQIKQTGKEEYIERLDIRKENKREQIEDLPLMSAARLRKIDELDAIQDQIDAANEELDEILEQLEGVNTTINQLYRELNP